MNNKELIYGLIYSTGLLSCFAVMIIAVVKNNIPLSILGVTLLYLLRSAIRNILEESK